MTRKGVRQKGQFEILRGMVFTMPDLDKIHPNSKLQPGDHPWLITDIFNDYVEIIMCTTITSNIENKHRLDDKHLRNSTDIPNPCPPMDNPKLRTSGAVLNSMTLLPKKELFSHTIQILNENTSIRNFKTHGRNSLCLDRKEIDNIQKEAREYRSNHPEIICDPFECEDWEYYLYDLEEGIKETVPKWFTKAKYDQRFKWQHLPKADWKAVYPFEDQMHDYEKADPELIQIARLKKYGPQKQKPKPSRKISHEEIVRKAETVSNRTKATPDDSYEMQ